MNIGTALRRNDSAVYSCSPNVAGGAPPIVGAMP